MKRFLAAVCLMVFMLTFFGCGQTPEGTQKNDAAALSVISLAPAITEVLIDLGAGRLIVAVDEYSAAIPGLPEGLPVFNMMEPDTEQLLALNPALLLASDLTSLGGQTQPFKLLEDAGVTVISLSAANSIAEIYEQIGQIADAIGQSEQGKALQDTMRGQMEAIAAPAKDYNGPVKTVFFEVADEPVLYSFGSDVFLTELMELLGAQNCLAEQSGWISVSEEAVIAQDPDVIFTIENYLPDPVQAIMTRPGWAEVTAVASGQVYAVDYDASSRANHRVVKVLAEMAKALYPALYES